VKKCQKKIVHFLKYFFKKTTPLSSQSLKKNTFSVSFLKKLKNDIFKNVKNRKKIFGIGIKKYTFFVILTIF
jgi:hypothetical protein